MARALRRAAAFLCLGALGHSTPGPTGDPGGGPCQAAGCPAEESEGLAWLQTASPAAKVAGASATHASTASPTGVLPKRSDKRTVHIATSACGYSLRYKNPALNLVAMVKSLAANAVPDRTYHVYAFTNQGLREVLSESLGGWPASDSEALRARGVFVEMHEADVESKLSRKFRLCSTQRLHLPAKLPEIDAVIYVDADTLWQVDPGVLWEHFWQFNASQHVGFALEREDPQGYNHRPRDFLLNGPFPPSGFNAGVMLWNLTRARQLGDRDRLVSTVLHDERARELADQDAFNLYAYAQPRRFFVLPCRYNLRAYSCCLSNPEADEPVLLHGNSGFFHQGKTCAGHRDFRASFRAALGWRYEAPIRWPKCQW